MALNQRTVILGPKALKFVRDGTVDGEDTVAADHAPATDPLSALYESLGDAENVQFTVAEDTINLRSARAGKWGPRKSIPMGQELSFNATLQDVTQLTFEALFRFDGAVTIGTGKIPCQQGAPITGWVWLELTDQTKTSTLEVLVYAELRVNQYQITEKSYSHELMIKVLENPLNLINVAALTAMAN